MNGSSWGFSHLADMPETVSFGVVLIIALIALIVLRVLFADVSIKGGVR